MKNLHSENYNTRLKEIKNPVERHLTGARSQAVGKTVPPTSVCRPTQSLQKFQRLLLTETGKRTLTFTWNSKGPRTANPILSKGTKSEDSCFSASAGATELQQPRQAALEKVRTSARLRTPRFDKGAKVTECGKISLFCKWCRGNWNPCARERSGLLLHTMSEN